MMAPQFPSPYQNCPPIGPPAPLLAVKALLPDGGVINPLPGIANSKDFPTGTTFGFRPGYSYPIKISQLPGNPNQSIYPVLEVRGTIVPRPGMKYMEIAAPLQITKADIEKILIVGMITKVIYLENPERAIPLATKSDDPLEISSDSADDAETEARRDGRIVAVLRIGDRIPTARELTAMTIPGTVLLPGEARLGTPAVPPCLPYGGIPLYDPLLGPKALKDECFINGGDGKDRIGIGPGRQLGGLDPSDVSAEYTINKQRKTSTSNTVCICAPRFIIRRADSLAQGFNTRVVAGVSWQYIGNSVFRQRTTVINAIAREKTMTTVGRERPRAEVAIERLHSFGSITGLKAFAMAHGLKVIGTAIEPEEVTNYPDQLTLLKSVSPPGPVAPGTELTITIRYNNHTRTPIDELVISDSLNGRLEYIKGSSAADRPSNVSTSVNDAGSVVVRFDIPGTIPPGASGTVQFKVKVR
jgi:hypothetical protein